VASPYPTGTFTRQETPSFARRDNVKPGPPPVAAPERSDRAATGGRAEALVRHAYVVHVFARNYLPNMRSHLASCSRRWARLAAAAASFRASRACCSARLAALSAWFAASCDACNCRCCSICCINASVLARCSASNRACAARRACSSRRLRSRSCRSTASRASIRWTWLVTDQ